MTQGILSGKKYLVTGGSRGIGAAIVETLAARGASVCFTFASQEESAKQVISRLPGDGHFCLQMNLNDESSINQALDRLTEKWPQVDGVVNNAGITKDQLILRLKTEDFDQVIATNLRGTFLVCKYFAKLFLKARSGNIVNITSIIGQTGNAGQSNYAASKAGVEAFTKSLALELATRGVRANCVAPGYIETEMTAVLSEDTKKAILAKIPMGAIGNARDVAHAVSFLLSDESKYITGQTLSVNGGMFLN